MTLIYFLIGTLLTFWGGYDLAQYGHNPERTRLFYCIATTALGVLNLIAAVVGAR
jgi:hypothetical protein